MKRLIVLLLIGIPFISSAAETEVYLEFRYINNCWLNGEKIIPSTGGDVILSFSQVSQTYDLMSLINYDIMQAGPLVKETIHLIFANYSESERLGQAVFFFFSNHRRDQFIHVCLFCTFCHNKITVSKNGDFITNFKNLIHLVRNVDQ